MTASTSRVTRNGVLELGVVITEIVGTWNLIAAKPLGESVRSITAQPLDEQPRVTGWMPARVILQCVLCETPTSRAPPAGLRLALMIPDFDQLSTQKATAMGVYDFVGSTGIAEGHELFFRVRIVVRVRCHSTSSENTQAG